MMESTVCRRGGHDFDTYGRCRLCGEHQKATTKTAEFQDKFQWVNRPHVVIAGKKYRPLLVGELREPGDVFSSGPDKAYDELPQYLDTPQTRTEKDDFLSQSYRPL